MALIREKAFADEIWHQMPHEKKLQFSIYSMKEAHRLVRSAFFRDESENISYRVTVILFDKANLYKHIVEIVSSPIKSISIH